MIGGWLTLMADFLAVIGATESAKIGQNHSMDNGVQQQLTHLQNQLSQQKKQYQKQQIQLRLWQLQQQINEIKQHFNDRA